MDRETELEAELRATREELADWRNTAIGLHAQLAAQAQQAQDGQRTLEAELGRVKPALAKARKQLDAATKRNGVLTSRLAHMDRHVEVRVRRRLGAMVRRMRSSR